MDSSSGLNAMILTCTNHSEKGRIDGYPKAPPPSRSGAQIENLSVSLYSPHGKVPAYSRSDSKLGSGDATAPHGSPPLRVPLTCHQTHAKMLWFCRLNSAREYSQLGIAEGARSGPTHGTRKLSGRRIALGRHSGKSPHSLVRPPKGQIPEAFARALLGE
jgi:hypothetical protein